MRRSAALLSLCFLPLLPLQERQDSEPPASERTLDDIAERYALAIQGAWKLSSYRDPAGFFREEQVVGYALFGDEYMSIELHGLAPTSYGGRENDEDIYFQSGMHRYQFDDAARLRTATVIGASNLNLNEIVDFEPPGRERVYNVSFLGDELELERVGGSADRGLRISFLRMGDAGKRKVDFFGRPIREEGEGAEARPDGRRRER